MIFDKKCEVKHNFDAALISLHDKVAPKFNFAASDEPVQH